MIAGLAKAAEGTNRRGLHLGFASCPPLIGLRIQRTDSSEIKECGTFNEAAAELIAAKGIKTVILVARWPLYAENWSRVGADARNKPLHLADAESPIPSATVLHPLFERALQRTVAYLGSLGVRVLIVEAVPENSVNVPNALALGQVIGRDISASGPVRAEVKARHTWVMAQFDALEASGAATLVRTHDVLCGPSRCHQMLDGVPLYRDMDHPSIPGALLLEPIFRAALTSE